MSKTLSRTTKALIVFNPAAGNADGLRDTIDEATAIWQEYGWEIQQRPTEGPGDATKIASRAADEGFDVVVAAGGDGTVNEVMNGLVGTKAALAALPVGTVNVWVRELGLPMQPADVAKAYLDARVEQIDVGKAGDRYFLLMAGIGFDAAVTAEVKSEEKKRLGIFAYAFRALQLGMKFQGMRARLTIDGREIRGRVLMVVVGNSQLYGGFVKLTARAVINDGLLDVCVIHGKSALSVPARLLSVVLGRYGRNEQVEYHRARTVRMVTSQSTPVQVDGDPHGKTPMLIEVHPGALYAVLPKETPGELLKSVPVHERRTQEQESTV